MLRDGLSMAPVVRTVSSITGSIYIPIVEMEAIHVRGSTRNTGKISGLVANVVERAVVVVVENATEREPKAALLQSLVIEWMKSINSKFNTVYTNSGLLNQIISDTELTPFCRELKVAC